MEENLKAYLKLNYFLGYDTNIDPNIGAIHCPTLKELGSEFFNYIYYVNQFIELYEDVGESMLDSVFGNQQLIYDFGMLLYYFIPTEDIRYFIDTKLFTFGEGRYLDSGNIKIFMEALRILHHRDKKDDNYKPSNKVAAEMIQRAKRLKKEIEQKQSNKGGTSFVDILSAICARHNSINPLNIKELNYFQIMEQYKRLLKIDAYTPCLYGNATEDYVKDNNIQHYSAEIIDK